MMGRGARLHHDHSGAQALNSLQQAWAADLRAMNSHAAACHAVELEHALGEVNPENIDLHSGLQ